MSEDTSDGFADQPREIDRALTLLRELGLSTAKAHLVAHALDRMRRLGREDAAAVCDSLTTELEAASDHAARFAASAVSKECAARIRRP